MTDKATEIGEAIGDLLDRLAPAPIEPIRCRECGEEFLWWSTFFMHGRDCGRQRTA